MPNVGKSTPWTTESLGNSVTRIDFGSRLWVLVTSDWHWDSIHCNREALEADLKLAKKLNAAVLSIGDHFDVMGGKYDPRSNGKYDLRPELQTGDYFDAVVKQGADWLKPYLDQMALITPGNHECLDEASEVMCRDGWKPISEVTNEDEVGMLHPITNEFLWSKPIKTHCYRYSGRMRHLLTRSADMLMTPNHRVCYLKQNSGSLGYIEADEIGSIGQVLSIPSSGIAAMEEADYSDDEIRFVGWMMTDGSFSKNQMTIYQSKPDRVLEIRELLERLGIPFRESVSHRNIKSIRGIELKSKPLPQHSFRIGVTESRRLSDSLDLSSKERFPAWVDDLSERQFGLLLEALIAGDGSIHKSSPNAMMLYGTEAFLENVQHLCVRNGYRAMLSERKRRDDQPTYLCLNITKNARVSCHGRNIADVEYEGNVYCLTTPTGNFFMRRNGRVCVTGNSSVRRRQETCLTTRLVERLRFQGARVQQGGYAGWVLFRGKKSANEASKNIASWRMWYHHGYGGGGPVTRGVIDFSRYLVDVDADAVVSGHIHQRTLIEAKRQRITSNGIPEISPIYLVRSSTYKDDSVTDGWAVEKGMSARPMGGWWLCLRFGGRNASQLVGTFHDRPLIEEAAE